jgi:hypothetical protein
MGEPGPRGELGAPGIDGKVEVVDEITIRDQAKYVGYPVFHPLMYSLDVFVPMVNFGQGDYWIPGTPQQRYLGDAPKSVVAFPDWKTLAQNDADLSLRLLWLWYWIQVGLGWLLISIFLASIAGFLEKKE